MKRLLDGGARLAQLLPPETAHVATVKSLVAAAPLLRRPRAPDARLATHVAGISFPNPLGLAAGFDKNAEAPDAMLGLGFGFVEVGAATPRAQAGNERPRVFRLREDRAVINRYGFNNDGVPVIADRLKRRKTRLENQTGPGSGVLGVNLGANKDSDDRTEDYVTGVNAFEGLVDFYTVNISSPNTPGLRALQDRAALDDLLARVLAARDGLKVRAPVFLKIAPDLTDEDKADIVASVGASSIDGLIVSNTTVTRPETLRGAAREQAGGLSGRPLFAPSTALLGEFYKALGDQTPLIGVGGVASARDAYEKILNGASLVQLYTALIYEGPGLIRRILDALPAFLSADGYSSIAAAIGAKLK
ncbi:MAG: quinone-dependent dihydroorotate dehydrogenase [Pseudomonadota bacterium]